MDWEQYFIQGLELLFLGLGTYFDVKSRELPLAFLTAFGLLGVACNIIWKYQSLKEVLIGCCIGGIFLVVGWLTKEAVGYGDGLSLVILGVFEGFSGMIPIVFGAFLLSGVYGLWRIIGLGEAASDTMPFFPFLFLALIGVIVI